MPSERVQRRIDALLDEADAAIAAGNWNLALQKSRDVLAFNPEDPDALAYVQAAERRLAEDDGRPSTSSLVDSEASEQSENTGREGTESALRALRPSSGQAPQDTFDSLTTGDDAPQSFVNGRYTVTGFLGEGGKKRVYLAHDNTLDRDVAFALIKAEGLDDSARQRITREAQAMGRLGDHPNIMPIFDLGDEAGVPYMVQPLMRGGDVEALINNAEDGRLELEVALRIATEVCRGLDFAHGLGIIHRDLKPGNIWLTDPSTGSGESTARIGDFGLAIATDRSRLTQEKMMIGTVSYMPPEQATGGEITPKADLYSLGAMLYEMVTGRAPFLGDDDIAIIGQHINTPPVAPQWHRPELPAQLDSLIMRLMSKNPAERPDSAADVLSALEAIDTAALRRAQDGGALTSSPPGGEGVVRGSGSLDSMAAGVFDGRHAEMDQLKAKLENALSGRGGMVTLVGEPGIGKTRTSLELETYAGLRNAQVLWGRCYEGGGAPPYWPWVQAIRSFVSSHEPEEIRSQMGSAASVIAEIVDDVKTSLPDLQAPKSLDDPESARFRLFDSIATFLKNAGQVKPLVIVLDDLHWADKPSLILLEFVARELASSRILIIGTYRDMELNRRHPLSVTLGDLSRERLFERVLLRGLSRADVGRFIEVAAGIDPPRGLIDAVHTQTEGNPLFVTETVRLLVQEGELTPERTSGRDSWSVRIPEGVREVIGRRLDRLSERCNDVLTIASIIGRQFTLGQLSATLNYGDEKQRSPTSEAQLLDVIDEALAARAIEEVSAEVDRYQFSHALFQETLLDEISLTRRVRMHANVAQAMEQLYGDNADSHAPELVTHFEQAQSTLGTEKLVHYALVAGDQAMATNAFEEALLHFETARRARSDDAMDEQLADVEFGLARAMFAALTPEHLNEVFDHMQTAFDFYVDSGITAKAVEVGILPIYPRPGALVEALPMIEKVRTLIDDDDPMLGHVMARYGYAIGRETADFDTAAAYLDQALEFANQAKDEDLQIWTHIAAINIGQNHLRLDWAKKNALKALELTARPSSTATDRARAIIQSSLMHTSAGTIAENLTLMQEGLAASERSGLKANVVESLWALGMAHMCRGELTEASAANERGLADYSTGGRLLSQRIQLDVYLGNFESARAYAVQLDEAGEGTARSVVVRCLLAPTAAMYARSSGDLSILEGTIEKTREAYESATVGIAWIQQGWAGVGMVAATLGDLETCRDIYENYELTSGTNVVGLPITVDRSLAIMASALGLVDEAAQHLEAALAFTANGRNVPEYAWASADYAELLIQRNSDGDHERAVDLHEEAMTTAQKLGMKPLVEQVLTQRELLN